MSDNVRVASRVRNREPLQRDFAFAAPYEAVKGKIRIAPSGEVSYQFFWDTFDAPPGLDLRIRLLGTPSTRRANLPRVRLFADGTVYGGVQIYRDEPIEVIQSIDRRVLR